MRTRTVQEPVKTCVRRSQRGSRSTPSPVEMYLDSASPTMSLTPSFRPLVASTSRISSITKRALHGTPSSRNVEAYARIRPEATHRSRYLAHYQNTLAPDLLYMTYNHKNTQNPPSPPALPSWDGANPHTKNRSRPRIKTALTPAPRPTTDQNLTQIESITLSVHVKQAAGACVSPCFVENREVTVPACIR